MNTSNRRNLIVLFFTLVVVMVGFGIVIPIMPFYIENLGASGSALGLLMAVYSLMQFLCAPLWGDLSDRYGRKPILLLGILGNAVTLILFGLSTRLWMLFVTRALAGVLSSATLPTAMAYVGDSTSHDERGGGMGVLGAAMGVGMVLGPGLGGPLAERSLSLPFFLAGGLSAIALILVAALLPESLPTEARTSAVRIQGPQIDQMWHALAGPVGVLLVLAFLMMFGLANFESVFGLYTLERYGYGPSQVGIILTLIGLVSAVLQGALTGPLSRWWGETNIIRASMLVSALGFAMMTLPRSLAGVIVAALIFIMGNSLLRPAVSALISKRATGGQGMAMGLSNSFMSLGRVFGPAWAGFAFDLHINLPYLSGAAIMAAGLAISLIWLAQEPRRQAQISDTDPIR